MNEDILYQNGLSSIIDCNASNVQQVTVLLLFIHWVARNKTWGAVVVILIRRTERGKGRLRDIFSIFV